MKLGIMQPYFMPYIGYWQLMNAVDKYVVYDDVNYIKKGWINKNRILVNGKPKYINIQLNGASQNKLINQIKILKNNDFLKKNLKTIEFVYRKAPYFDDIYPIIERIFKCEANLISEYIYNSFEIINDYLEITTELIMSSNIKKDNSLKGSKKILSICEILNADEYYNAIGGRDLYSFDEFKKNGIKLNFLSTDKIVYKQFKNQFIDNLSIIDVLMFNSKNTVIEYLNRYKLITN